MTPKRIAFGLGVIVLIASGAYLLVYLYRWEWNRAMIAGLFFVAAEVGLATATIHSRLSRLESTLHPEHETVRRRIEEAAPPARQHFSWLEHDASRMQVFVPVLLGAGVVMSGLAWLVDRLAQITAKPAMETRLTAQVAEISFPPGGVFGTARADGRNGHRLLSVRHGVVAVVVAGLAWGGIDLLADATQNRPDMALPDMHTTIALEVHTKNTSRSAESLVEALWIACRGTVTSSTRLITLTPLSIDRAVFELRPALGTHAKRRFQGCLEDATLDRIQANVVSWDTLPN